MASYNTQYDAANTAVRAFLTRIGEYYLKRSFNTAVKGIAKNDWIKIKEDIFEGKCAYCGKSSEKLQMDHLIMINRTEFGLHHPGNIVPACPKCNKRSKGKLKSYNSWGDHLSYICENNKESQLFLERWKKIRKHLQEGDYVYPNLSTEEESAIRIIANNLYEIVKQEFDRALDLYKKLDESFSKR